MPPIGMALGKADFTSLFVVLDSSKGIPASLADAKQKAIPVLACGQLINDVVNFLIVAAVIFLIVRQVNRLKNEHAAAPNEKDCPKCLSSIPLAAVRCASCCSDL